MNTIIQKLVSVFALVLLLASTSAFALDLGQAKAQGLSRRDYKWLFGCCLSVALRQRRLLII